MIVTDILLPGENLGDRRRQLVAAVKVIHPDATLCTENWYRPRPDELGVLELGFTVWSPR